MNQIHMLYPVFALVALTFFVLIRGAIVRFRAVRLDGLNPGYFKYNRGGKPPEYMLRTEQNFNNLLELPILFYVAVIFTYITTTVDLANIVLAWLFVISRIMHSYVHIRFNRIMQRRRFFLFGFYILMALWAKLFIQLLIR